MLPVVKRSLCNFPMPLLVLCESKADLFSEGNQSMVPIGNDGSIKYLMRRHARVTALLTTW
jgi:hypothetical protein